MTEQFFIGQIFAEQYPPEAAGWCNRNEAHIEKNDAGMYIIVENERAIPTKAELTAFVSAEADKVAYGGITVVANDEKYLFATNAENISRCGAMLPIYQTMSDTETVLWEVSREGLIYMLPVSKVEFMNGYRFGVQMTVQVQTVKGAICSEIREFTDEQLTDEQYIAAFKESAIIRFNEINKIFELTTTDKPEVVERSEEDI